MEHADFVALHEPAYLGTYDVTADLKPNGTFLLNCGWSKEELASHIPAKMKRDLAGKNASMYLIDATKIAREIGLGGRTNTVLQAAFFKLTNIIPLDLAVQEMKEGIYHSYLKKAGQAVVEMNARPWSGASPAWSGLIFPPTGPTPRTKPRQSSSFPASSRISSFP